MLINAFLAQKLKKTMEGKKAINTVAQISHLFQYQQLVARKFVCGSTF